MGGELDGNVKQLRNVHWEPPGVGKKYVVASLYVPQSGLGIEQMENQLDEFKTAWRTRPNRLRKHVLILGTDATA